jgi:hypothetical protein
MTSTRDRLLARLVSIEATHDRASAVGRLLVAGAPPVPVLFADLLRPSVEAQETLRLLLDERAMLRHLVREAADRLAEAEVAEAEARDDLDDLDRRFHDLRDTYRSLLHKTTTTTTEETRS